MARAAWLLLVISNLQLKLLTLLEFTSPPLTPLRGCYIPPQRKPRP
jgi:hypothetical protein